GRRPGALRVLRLLAIAALLVVLSACGGGGDDGTTVTLSDPPNTKDTATPVQPEPADPPLQVNTPEPPAPQPPAPEPAEAEEPAAAEDWEAYWTERLSTVPRLFAVDYIQPDQMVSGDGQEDVIARYPLVITCQLGSGVGTRRVHLDTIRDLTPDIVLLAYL